VGEKGNLFCGNARENARVALEAVEVERAVTRADK